MKSKVGHPMKAGDLVRLVDNPSSLGTLAAQPSGSPPRERVPVKYSLSSG